MNRTRLMSRINTGGSQELIAYRRVMSRLDRLIASSDCPPQLRMLKSF